MRVSARPEPFESFDLAFHATSDQPVVGGVILVQDAVRLIDTHGFGVAVDIGGAAGASATEYRLGIERRRRASRAFPKFESYGTVGVPAFCGHKSRDGNGQES